MIIKCIEDIGYKTRYQRGVIMVKYTWFKENVPDNLKVRQVYGIVFTNDKRVLLKIDDNKYELTGGKPQYNETYEETLKREYIEEINVFLSDIYYLGYLLIEEDNISYVQVRMIAKVEKINELKPDKDNGKLYQRKLVNIKNIKKYLNYSGVAGNKMIDDAINLANIVYNFSYQNELEEFV